MKNVLAIAGYGDKTWYISALTYHWRWRYGLKVHPLAFGTAEAADRYPELWEEKVEPTLKRLGTTSIIGISFGFGIAARAKIEHPDIVDRIVGISCPHSLDDMDQNIVDKNYAMLNYSLSAFNMADLPAADVMTFRCTQDDVIDPDKVIIPGARNEIVKGYNHGSGIVSALAFGAPMIAQFLKEGRPV